MEKKPKVIIVEDKVYWQNLFKEYLLEAFDVSIDIFSEFKSAESKLTKMESIDLAIVDLSLDSQYNFEDSFELVEYLTNIKCTPVIIVSGFPDFQNLQRANKLNTYAFFPKQSFSKVKFINATFKVLSKYSIAKHDSISFNGNKGIIIIQNSEGKIENISMNYIESPNSLDVETLQKIISPSLNSIVKSYSVELRNELDLVIKNTNSSILNIKTTINDILNVLNELKNENQIAGLFFEELINAHRNNNKSFIENKIKISLMLIPGILNLETNINTNQAIEKLNKLYDAATFPIYEKLIRLYYSLKDKMLSISSKKNNI
jgi:hypothetical protein